MDEPRAKLGPIPAESGTCITAEAEMLICGVHCHVLEGYLRSEDCATRVG